VRSNEPDKLLADGTFLVVLFAFIGFLLCQLLCAVILVRREGEELVAQGALVAATNVPSEVDDNKILASGTTLGSCQVHSGRSTGYIVIVIFVNSSISRLIITGLVISWLVVFWLVIGLLCLLVLLTLLRFSFLFLLLLVYT
jgi:hypothetical protein